MSLQRFLSIHQNYLFVLTVVIQFSFNIEQECGFTYNILDLSSNWHCLKFNSNHRVAFNISESVFSFNHVSINIHHSIKCIVVLWKFYLAWNFSNIVNFEINRRSCLNSEKIFKFAVGVKHFSDIGFRGFRFLDFIMESEKPNPTT